MRVEDVIEVALDAKQEGRPDWFLSATRTLQAIDATYLGRRNGKQFAIAQCVRELPASEIAGPGISVGKVQQWLYRIWGKSKLRGVTVTKPYVILSQSFRWKKDGEIAIFDAREIDGEFDIPEDKNGMIWPLSYGPGFADSCEFSGVTVDEAWVYCGITHTVACDAFVRNPPRRRNR